MGKYLDWYLVELERSLDKRMSPEATFELLNQTEDHVTMIKQELMLAGMDEIQAEQAAIQRFGQLDTLAGKPKEKPVTRANWAAPVLVVVGATIVVGASMVVGSNDSRTIAGVLGLASLILSALLCFRKGQFPGLAFGALFTFCFASLSGIASYEFYGIRAEFAKRSDKAEVIAALKAGKIRAEEVRHLFQVGKAWGLGNLGRHIPTELRTPSGIVAPEKGDWGYEYTISNDIDGGLRNAPTLLGIGSSSVTGLSFQASTIITTTFATTTKARQQWRDFAKSGQRVFFSRNDGLERLNQAISLLSENRRYDTDNLFGGILVGTVLTSIWMLIAFLFNRIASFEWIPEPRRRAAQPRIARS